MAKDNGFCLSEAGFGIFVGIFFFVTTLFLFLILRKSPTCGVLFLVYLVLLSVSTIMVKNVIK